MISLENAAWALCVSESATSDPQVIASNTSGSSNVATFEDPEVFEAMTCGSEVALSDTHSAHAAFSREIIAQENDDWADVLCRIEARLPVKVYWVTEYPQVPPATACEH